jgi:hypothetical protein
MGTVCSSRTWSWPLYEWMELCLHTPYICLFKHRTTLPFNVSLQANMPCEEDSAFCHVMSYKKGSIFWVITQCSPLKVNWRSGVILRLHLRFEGNILPLFSQPKPCSTFLVNGGAYLPNYTASHPRRPPSSYSPHWERQISCTMWYWRLLRLCSFEVMTTSSLVSVCQRFGESRWLHLQVKRSTHSAMQSLFCPGFLTRSCRCLMQRWDGEPPRPLTLLINASCDWSFEGVSSRKVWKCLVCFGISVPSVGDALQCLCVCREVVNSHSTCGMPCMLCNPAAQLCSICCLGNNFYDITAESHVWHSNSHSSQCNWFTCWITCVRLRKMLLARRFWIETV